MRGALHFLTVIGRGTTPDGRTLRWFPIVGLLIGAVVGGVWWGADRLFPPLLAAGLVVAVDLALTGLLHLDGLADAADGLLPHLRRERRLAIMADSTVGAFAVTIVVLTLLLRTAAFASRPVSVLLVLGLWCASRSILALIASTRPYARENGIATVLLGDRAAPLTALGGVIVGTGLAVAGIGWPGLAATASLLAVSAAVLLLAERRVGGFTGDVLGAIAVLGETVALIVAAARW